MDQQLLSELMEISATVGDVEPIGTTHAGERRFIAITGGRFAGRLGEGRVLPGGADWQLLRADGVADLTARYVLETARGAKIEVQSNGYRHGPPEVIARLAAGEQVDPGEYYFRTAMRFETGDADLGWLNRALGLGVGQRLANEVRLRVYEVL